MASQTVFNMCATLSQTSSQSGGQLLARALLDFNLMSDRVALITSISLAVSNFLTVGLFWLVPFANAGAQANQLFISEGLKQHIIKYQGAQPVWGGPNCWNLALSATGIIPALRHSTAEEMSFFMESPLCRRRGPNEKPQPGDVGAIRQKSTVEPTHSREIHGFIFVSDNLVYSKSGSRPWDSPFALQPYQDIEKLFVTPKTETDYFQCQSMQKYFEQHIEAPAKLKKVLKTLDRFEEQLQIQSFEAKRLSPFAKEIWFKFVVEFKDYFASARGYSNASPEVVSFIVNAIKIRLQSISQHLSVTSFDRDFASEIDRLRDETR